MQMIIRSFTSLQSLGWNVEAGNNSLSNFIPAHGVVIFNQFGQ